MHTRHTTTFNPAMPHGVQPISGGAPIEGESAAGAADAGGGNEIEFEVDLESDAEPDFSSSAQAEDGDAAGERSAPGRSPAATPAVADAAAAAAAGAIPPQVQEILNRVARENAELRGMVEPMVRGHRDRELANAGAPPVTEDFLLNNPNATMADLLKYMNWQQARAMEQLSGTATSTARRATSENMVRGQLSAAALGQGHDYDSFRQKYVEPMYTANPAIRELVDAAAGSDGNPAMLEYTVAMVQHVAQRLGNDPIAAFKTILAAIDAPATALEDTTKKITEAQERGADKIARAGRAPSGKRQKLDASAIWNMKDEDFDRLAGVM